MIGLLMAWAVVGMEGIPIPYSPRMDDGITVVLLCCFFLSAYVLSRSRKFLLQLVKDFLLHRERTSIFATSTAADMRYLLLLIGTPVFVLYDLALTRLITAYVLRWRDRFHFTRK